MPTKKQRSLAIPTPPSQDFAAAATSAYSPGQPVYKIERVLAEIVTAATLVEWLSGSMRDVTFRFGVGGWGV